MARGVLTLRALPQATSASARVAHFGGYRLEFRALSVNLGNEETPESRKGVLLMNFSLATEKAGVDELSMVLRLLAVSTPDSQNAVRVYPEQLCARMLYRV